MATQQKGLGNIVLMLGTGIRGTHKAGRKNEIQGQFSLCHSGEEGNWSLLVSSQNETPAQERSFFLLMPTTSCCTPGSMVTVPRSPLRQFKTHSIGLVRCWPGSPLGLEAGAKCLGPRSVWRRVEKERQEKNLIILRHDNHSPSTQGQPALIGLLGTLTPHTTRQGHCSLLQPNSLTVFFFLNLSEWDGFTIL